MISTRRRVRFACLMVMQLVVFGSLHAQQNKVGGPGSANYRLATRFAPYKLDKLIYSTNVDPHWIEGTEKFWYEWTSGKPYVALVRERDLKEFRASGAPTQVLATAPKHFLLANSLQ